MHCLMKDKILIRQTYVAIVLSELYAQVASLHSYIWLTYVQPVLIRPFSLRTKRNCHRNKIRCFFVQMIWQWK